MSKVFHIYETKSVTYTHRVYAKTKAEALQKFKSTQDYEEIGLDPAGGDYSIEVSEMGKAREKCAVCGKAFSPESVRDYRCPKCEREKYE